MVDLWRWIPQVAQGGQFQALPGRGLTLPGAAHRAGLLLRPGAPTRQEFRQAYLKRREEQRAFLPWALDVLFNSGLYAVGAFVRSAVFGEDPYGLDPLGAAWRGLKAAWDNDQEYQVELSKLLSDQLGWRPESLAGKAAKFAVGLIGDILLDPLTYLTFGVGKGAVRLSKEMLETTAASSVRSFPRVLLGGQWIRKKVAKKLFPELGGKTPEALRTVAGAVVQGAAGEIVEPEQIGKILQGLGKKVTEENIGWWIKEGWKEVLDPGGVKYFGKQIYPYRPGPMTPRLSSLTGLFLGDRIKSNAPLLMRVAESKTWQRVVSKPLQRVNGKLKKIAFAFSRFAGTPREVREDLNRLFAAAQAGAYHARAQARSLVHLTWEEVQEVPVAGGAVLRLPRRAYDEMSVPERKWMGRFLSYARYRGLSGETLRREAYKALTDPSHGKYHYVVDLGLQRKISPQRAEALARASERASDFFRRLRQIEEQAGLGNTIDPEYFARIYKKEGWKIPPGQEELQAWANRADPYWFNRRQQLMGDWDTLTAAYKAGDPNVPGMLEDDFLRVAEARIGATFKGLYQLDALSRIIRTFGRYKGVERAVRELPEIFDPKFRAKNPHIVQAVIGASRQGLPWKGKRGAEITGELWHETLRKLRTQGRNPPRVREIGYEFIDKIEKATPTLTPENIRIMLQDLEDIASQRLRELGDTATYHEFQHIKEVLKTTLEAKQLQRTIDQIGLEFALSTRQKFRSPRVQAILRYLKKKHYMDKAAPFFETPREILDNIDIVGLRHETFAQVLERHFNLPVDTLQFHARIWNRDILPQIRKAIQIADDPIHNYYQLEPTWRSLRGYLNQTEEQLAELAGKRGAEQAARRGLLAAQYATLARALESMPGPSFWTAKGERAAQKFNRLRMLVGTWNAALREKGLSKFAPALKRQLIGKADWNTVTPKQLEKAIEFIEKEIPDAAEDWKRALRPPDFNEKYVSLAVSRGLKIRDPATGELVPLTRFELPESVAIQIARYQNQKVIAKQLSWLRAATNSFRALQTSNLLFVARPAFFTRNAVDLSARGAMGLGVGFWKGFAKHYSAASRVLRGEKGVIKLANGLSVDMDFLREELLRVGLWRSGVEKLDIQRGGGLLDKVIRTLSEDKWLSYRRMVDKLDAATRKLPLVRMLNPRYVAARQEGLPVVAGVLGRLEAGMPWDQAIEEVRRTFFSFHTLTDFERDVMRLLFPFYTWARQAFPFYLERALHRPAVYAGLVPKIQALAELTPEERAAVPEWIREYPYVKIETKGRKLRITSMRNILTSDVLPDWLPRNLTWRGLAKWFSRLNPILLAPVELAFGADLYFGRKIEERRRLFRGLESEALRKDPLIREFLKPEEVTIGGRKYITVDGHRWHLLKRLWFSRFWRELATVSAVLEGALPPVELSRVLSGFKVYEIDLDRQLNLALHDADRAWSQYRSALKQGDKTRAEEIIHEVFGK